MRVIYNGVDLMVLETHALDCEAVYDDSGTDYLYTRVSVAVRALVNGQAEVVNGPAPGPFISYAWEPIGTFVDLGDPLVRPDEFSRDVKQVVPPARGAFVNVPAAEGVEARARMPLRGIRRVPNAPPLSHQTVRYRLSTPQAYLYVFSGQGMEGGAPLPGSDNGPAPPAVLMFNSPQNSARCDCKNGPFPKLFNVQMALGDANTLIVDWACETYIHEGPQNEVNPTGVLLSNRFGQVHDIDDDGYTTITTEGTAIFRTDLVYEIPFNPDADRPLLFLPIPPGFKRENIQVVGRPDVTGVNYSFRDVQQSVNFPAGPYAKASKMSAVHRQAISVNAPDIVGSALNIYERVLGIKANRNFAAGHKEDADDGKALKALEKAIGRGVRRALGLGRRGRAGRPAGGPGGGAPPAGP